MTLAKSFTTCDVSVGSNILTDSVSSGSRKVSLFSVIFRVFCFSLTSRIIHRKDYHPIYLQQKYSQKFHIQDQCSFILPARVITKENSAATPLASPSNLENEAGSSMLYLIGTTVPTGTST